MDFSKGDGERDMGGGGGDFSKDEREGMERECMGSLNHEAWPGVFHSVVHIHLSM